MRIVCPSCAAAYDVPNERLAPGRIVQCAQCATGWAPVVAVLRTAPSQPASSQPAAPQPASPQPAPPKRLPSPAELPAPYPEPPGFREVLAGWAASFAVLAVLLGAAYAWRVEVMRAWPPSERAYALLGLA